jgi:hypothetical protein
MCDVEGMTGAGTGGVVAGASVTGAAAGPFLVEVAARFACFGLLSRFSAIRSPISISAAQRRNGE